MELNQSAMLCWAEWCIFGAPANFSSGPSCKYVFSRNFSERTIVESHGNCSFVNTKVRRSHVVLNGMKGYTFKVVCFCWHHNEETFDLSVLFDLSIFYFFLFVSFDRKLNSLHYVLSKFLITRRKLDWNFETNF